VREALYDGPVDEMGYQVQPVILEKIPSLAEGDVVFEPVQAAPGDTIVDEQGNVVVLEEGVRYFPSGCSDASCAQAYSGQEPVVMDSMRVSFRLRSGLTWSDGAPLTSGDSVFSFEVAQGLYPRVRPALLDRTLSYQATDELGVEWRGLPGARQPGFQNLFFTPLPRHAWGAMPAEELLTAELSTRSPLGWGPYRIDEWTPGDHITLSKNPNYFRAAEGLPHFEQLVFRFVSSPEEALEALLAGECDLADQTTGLEGSLPELTELEASGRLALSIEESAWEHLDFGVSSSDPARVQLFSSKEVRQAVAACIDRERLASELFQGRSSVPHTYLPSGHPLANSEARSYPYDPQAASAALEAAGWVDADANPATPRLAQGVAGVPDGTPFTVTLVTTDEPEKQAAAALIRDSLAQCGVQVEISAGAAAAQFAPGPDGPVFGRRFDLAQYAWPLGLESPCYLYTSAEIPGAFPEFPKGWGGANASGFSNAEYDRVCAQARAALPGAPEYESAHRQAQALFAEELPALPLYWRPSVVAYRPDLCGLQPGAFTSGALANLESLGLGPNCP